MMKYIFFILLMFTLPLNQLSAQAVIKAGVKDAAGQTLEGATVQLKRAKDSAVLRQTRSTRQGFQLRRVAAGNYILQLQFLGFATIEKQLVVRSTDTLLILDAIVMQAAPDTSLIGVVVKASIPPVLVKKDTIVYNASAYKLGPNASVQELLKKLPGVQVDKEGNVTVQGQKVEKIYVDGKEFLLSDPKLLTKDFPADMLAAVEAFDQQSEESRFSGIKDFSGTKALNFRMKKDMRNMLVGKVYGAQALGRRYSVGGSLQKLSPNEWLNLSINENTLNDLFKGYNELPRMGGSAGDKKNREAMINYRNRFSNKISGGFSYRMSDVDNRIQRNSVRRDFLTDSILNKTNKQTQQTAQLQHQFRGDLLWQTDSMQSIVFRPTISFRKSDEHMSDSSVLRSEKNGTQSLINQVQRRQSENSTQLQLGGSVSYRRRFQKPGRSAVIGFSYNDNNTDDDRVLQTSSSFQQLDQQSTRTLDGNNIGIQAFYTEPIAKGKILDFQYAYQQHNNQSTRATYNYNAATGFYDQYDSLTSNQFVSSNISHRAAMGINIPHQRIRYQAGLASLCTLQQNEVLSGKGNNVNQTTVNWMPRASMQVEVNTQTQLIMRYTGRSQQPSADQLQPLIDPTNPLLIKKGNAALRPSFNHSWNISYVKADRKTARYLMLDLGLNLTTNKITPSTQLLQGGVQEQQMININGIYDVNASINYSIPVLEKSGMLRIGQRVRAQRDKSMINQQENVQEQIALNPFVSLRCEPVVGLSIEGEANLDYSSTHYTFGNRRVELLRSNYGMNLRYELPGGLLINSDLSIANNPAQAGLQANQVTLWNSTVSKYFLTNRQAEIRLSAFDLLDQNKGVQQFAGEQYIEQSNVNMQQQLWLLSFVWNFKKAGS